MSRLHDELTRGAPVLERLLADGVAGRFPAEEVDVQDWRDMLKHAQELRLKLRKRLNQRTESCSAPAVAEERQESCETLREKREALRQRRIRASDIASLAQIERELYEVEEQLVSKKIAERLPVSLAAKSATLAALERVEKARKELDEASRELLSGRLYHSGPTTQRRLLGAACSYGSAPGSLGTVPARRSARSVRPSARSARPAASARSVRPSARSARLATSARYLQVVYLQAVYLLVPARHCARSARLPISARSALCLLGTSSCKCPLGTVPARHV